MLRWHRLWLMYRSYSVPRAHPPSPSLYVYLLIYMLIPAVSGCLLVSSCLSTDVSDLVCLPSPSLTTGAQAIYNVLGYSLQAAMWFSGQDGVMLFYPEWFVIVGIILAVASIVFACLGASAGRALYKTMAPVVEHVRTDVSDVSNVGDTMTTIVHAAWCRAPYAP